MEEGIHNLKSAHYLISQFIAHGLFYFCLSPGSRSTPLVLALSQYQNAIKTFVHFDERGMGFHALGFAKGSQKPVVLIVTSGTALGNLYPAIMEAYHDQIPLIILTADRPPELRDVGANQTTKQTNFFHSFVVWHYDLPCPILDISKPLIATTVSQAVLASRQGPVHLNCMFRKPLTPKMLTPISNSNLHTPRLFVGKSHLTSTDHSLLVQQLKQYKQGVILAASSLSPSCFKYLITLAHLLKWPIFPDILSQMRSIGNTSYMTTYYDLILKTLSPTLEAVLQIGDRFVSATLSSWIKEKKPSFYCHIAPHNVCFDHLHLMTHRVIADPCAVLEALTENLEETLDSSWIDQWHRWQSNVLHCLSTYFKKTNLFSEALLFHRLPELLSDDFPLFIANSLPIRMADMFFHSTKPTGVIYGNRGLSGIDGNIATAIGLATSLKRPLVALIGDLTCLHDLNSLAQIKTSGVDLMLIVINNQGGGIFSFLPTITQSSDFTNYFVGSHSWDFSHIASLFELNYVRPKHLNELETYLQTPPFPCLIEIQTKRDDNIALQLDILNHIEQSIASVSLSLP